MENLDLIVFDMAGTTIADSGQVPEAFTSALRAHGLDVSGDELRAVRGASKHEAIRRLVAARMSGEPAEIDARAERIFTDFRERLARIYSDGGVAAIPGAAEVFARLRREKRKVALNTGFDRDTTRLILRGVGWEQDTVDAVVCGDDVAQGRPAPYLIFRAMEATGTIDVRRVANVGDTTLDLQAGWNAAVRWNVGVLSGAHPRERLAQSPHTHLIENVAALWSAFSTGVIQ